MRRRRTGVIREAIQSVKALGVENPNVRTPTFAKNSR